VSANLNLENPNSKLTLLICRAEKAPSQEDADNWDVKLIGMNAEEAKEWNGSGFGQHWIIRYVLPSEEEYPCFLLAQRSSEAQAATLAQSTASHLEGLSRFHITGRASSVAPGKQHIFTLSSSAA